MKYVPEGRARILRHRIDAEREERALREAGLLDEPWRVVFSTEAAERDAEMVAAQVEYEFLRRLGYDVRMNAYGWVGLFGVYE